MPSHSGRHVLIVNHAPEILDLVREMLEAVGYRVTSQLRADQDINTIAAAAPDVIVVYYLLPSADNLWSLLNLLTTDQRTRKIPVIVCTAAARPVQEMNDQLHRRGVRVVDKPFDIVHLLEAVAEVLDVKAIDKEGISSGPM